MALRIPRWFQSGKRPREAKRRRLGSRISRFEPLEERRLLSLNGSANLDFTIEGIAIEEAGGGVPPDPHGAAGPTNLVSVVNTNIEIYSKTGTLQLSEDFDTFFAPLAPATTPFDPKVLYDQHADRFVIVALEQFDTDTQLDPGNMARILLAVSDNDDPNGIWHFQAINSRTFLSGPAGIVDAWFDYPGLAVDEEAIYVTGNMFAFADGLLDLRSRLYIISKGEGSAGLYDGGTSIARPFDPGVFVGQPNLFTLQPAHIYGDAPAGVGTFLAAYSISVAGDNETLNVIRVDDPLDTVPSFDLQQIALGDIDDPPFAIGGTSFIDDAPQLGTDIGIEANGGRVLSAVWRNDSLWAINTVVPPNGPDAGQATAHWYQVDTTNLGALALADQGDIGGEEIAPGTHTFWPTIMVDADGNMAAGFAASGLFIYPGAYFTGRRADDAPGTTRTPTALAAGEDFYVRTNGGGRNRWGDYTGLAIDPSDEATFWIYNEYAIARDPVTDAFGEDGRWGTRWGRFDLDLTPAVGINLSIDDVTLFEGDSGTKSFDFAVTLSEDPAGAVSVGFITSNGTATTVSGDYLGTQGTLTFTPGGPLTQTVNVQVVGNTTSEFDETFFVSLTAPVGAAIVKGQGVGTIRNDDGGIGGPLAALDTTFEGIEFSPFLGNPETSSGSIPPDPHGAAGLNHVVNVVNTNIQIFTKSGVEQLTQSLSTFFAPVNPISPFDPKIVYDQYADRFVVVALDLFDSGTVMDPTNTSRILLAVSDDSDPNGSWAFQEINSRIFDLSLGVTTDFWADYPGIGIGEDAIFISNNLFPFADGVFDQFRSRLWTVAKGEGTGGLYDGGTSFWTLDDPGAEVGRDFLFTLQPAQTYGNVPNGVGTYLLSYSPLDGGSPSILNVIRVDDPLSGQANYTLTEIPLGNIDMGISMVDAPQLGSERLIEAGDRRILEAVWRDNELWAVNTIVPSSGPDTQQATAHWYKIDTTSPTSPFLADQGNVGGEDIAPGTYTFWPSIAVDGGGNMAMGFAASGPQIFAGAYYTGRFADDPAGTTLGAGLLAAGEASYVRTFGSGRNRWGDYSGIAIDPKDDGTFWLFNEYATERGEVDITGEDGRWATRWGSFAFSTAAAGGAAFAITDVTRTEGDAGTTAFDFTVTLSSNPGGTASVAFTTADGSANENIDYQPTSGSLFFTPGGALSQTITVLVNGEIALEPNETFFVNLSNPIGASMLDGQGVGTILNDDDTPASANTPPTAVDDLNNMTTANLPVAIPVLGNDIEPDPGDSLVPGTIEIGITPTDGTLDIDLMTGVITYTPDLDFGGIDSFSYTVRDTFGARSNEAVVTVDVSSAPTALDDGATTAVNSPVVIPVLENDTDVDGVIDPGTMMIVSGPTNGGVVINPTGTVTYTPNLDFAGGDEFTYRVRDNDGLLSNEATVRIRVGDAVTLSGEVYADINNNGIRDAGELGIENVPVTISKTDGSLTFSHAILTDADGQYSLVENPADGIVLPPGAYSIVETQPVVFHDGIDTPGSPPPTGPVVNDQFNGIVLGSGQSATGFQFGERGLRGEFIDDFLEGNLLLAAGTIPASGFGAALPSDVDVSDDYWLTFDAGWEGTLEVTAQFLSIQGSAALTLYDDDMNQLATSPPEINQSRLAWEGTAGEPYLLRLSGTNDRVQLGLTQTIDIEINAPPQITSPGPLSVEEGGTFALMIDADDPNGDPLTYLLQPGAPAGASLDPVTGAFSWTPSDGSGNTVQIPIIVLDDGNPEAGDAVVLQVTVANVGPDVGIAGPSAAQPDGFVSLALTAADPSATDQASDFSYSIDWDGDGTFDETIVGPASIQVDHTYDETAAYSVRVAATDKDGGTGPAATHVVTVATAPDVQEIRLRSSDWTPQFLAALESAGNAPSSSGDSGMPAEILPWDGIDTIEVKYGAPLEVAIDDLSVVGVNVGGYGFLDANDGGFSYDPETFTATWRLAEPIATDRVAILLAGTAEPLQVGIAPGDINGDGATNSDDYTLWANKFGAAAGSMGTRSDLNGNSFVEQSDYTIWSNYFGTALPSGDPLGGESAAAEAAALMTTEASLDDALLDLLGADIIQAASMANQALPSGELALIDAISPGDTVESNRSQTNARPRADSPSDDGNSNHDSERPGVHDRLRAERARRSVVDSLHSRLDLNWLLHDLLDVFDSDTEDEDN